MIILLLLLGTCANTCRAKNILKFSTEHDIVGNINNNNNNNNINNNNKNNNNNDYNKHF